MLLVRCSISHISADAVKCWLGLTGFVLFIDMTGILTNFSIPCRVGVASIFVSVFLIDSADAGIRRAKLTQFVHFIILLDSLTDFLGLSASQTCFQCVSFVMVISLQMPGTAQSNWFSLLFSWCFPTFWLIFSLYWWIVLVSLCVVCHGHFFVRYRDQLRQIDPVCCFDDSFRLSDWFLRFVGILDLFSFHVVSHGHFSADLGTCGLRLTQLVRLIGLLSILTDFSGFLLTWICFHCVTFLMVISQQVRAHADSNWLSLLFWWFFPIFWPISPVCWWIGFVFVVCHFWCSHLCRCGEVLAQID